MSETYNHNRKGSEWRKWDLHLHTPYTNLNGKEFKATDEDFIKKLKEQEIAAVALTNYFYFKEEEYVLQEKIAKEGIAAFLNLELRITYTNKEDQCCDIHIIFSDDVTKSEIDIFLTKLHLNVDGKPKMAITLKPEELQSATVEFAELINVLKDPTLNLEQRHFIGFLSRGHGNSRSSSNFETLYQNCDFLLHSSDEEKNLIQDREFWGKLNRPLLQSSDAHNIDSVGKKFSWIKADTTSEGLKQVMYEPIERLSLSQSRPDYKQKYQLIDSIELNDPNLWECKIEFNENLNTIIGGRSTGKSSLLTTIARKLGSRNAQESKNYHFIEEALSKVQIKWSDGQFNDSRDIEFYPQSYMNMLAFNNDERNQLIEGIIKRKDIKGVLLKYTQLAEEEKSLQESQVTEILKTRDLIHTKTMDLAELGDISGVNAEIQRIKTELAKYRSDFSQEESDEYEALQAEIEAVDTEFHQSQIKISSLDLLKNQRLFSDEFYNLNPLRLGEELHHKLEILKQSFVKEWSDTLDSEISLLNEKCSQLHEQKAKLKLTPTYLRGQEHLNKNASAAQLKTQLDIENDKLKEIEEKSNELKKIKIRLDIAVKQLSKSHERLKINAQNLTNELYFEESDLAISVTSSFDGENIEKILEEQLNRTKHRDFISHFIENYDDKPEITVKELIDLTLKKQLTLKGTHTEQSLLNQVLCNNTYKQNYELNYQSDTFNSMSQGKQAFVILKLLLEFNDKTCPVLIDQPEDSLDNRAIYNELVQYLKQKKKERQIILVTHNPNVVVSADSEQVIVANQHDPNSRNSSGIKFQYVTGGIEHTFPKDDSVDEILYSQGIREHICEILEGGEDAFKKREQKYQLNK